MAWKESPACDVSFTIFARVLRVRYEAVHTSKRDERQIRVDVLIRDPQGFGIYTLDYGVDCFGWQFFVCELVTSLELHDAAR